jgi:hypothetical protein
MSVFNDILRLKVVGDRKLQRLIDSAVTERVQLLMERFPVFEETGDPASLGLRFSTGTSTAFKDKLKETEQLKSFLTEKRSPIRVKVAGLRTMKSPYKYKRIDDFFLKESYFSRSVIRQIETMLRNGHSFVSEDAAMASEVRKEINRIEKDSGVGLNQMLYRWVKDLQTYGIFVGEKVRQRKRDPNGEGDKRKTQIVRLRPILPHDMVVYVDEYSRIVSVVEAYHWGSSVRKLWATRGKLKTIPGIPAGDLIISPIYDAGDLVFPSPPCFQALDDILTLRSLEETVELLCFQFGSPLLHTQVGTKEEPAYDGEVTEVNNKLVAMAPNGMVATDHRVSIVPVNLQTGVANLMPYIEHFKVRVLVGSGSSPISVGEGDSSNRSTAESIDDALSDHCTYLADVICNIFNQNIIPDVLLSKGMNESELYDNNGELKVQLEFNETRLEKQISRENAIINKWNSSLITLPEARKMLKHPPLTADQEKDLHINKIQIPLKMAGGGIGDEGNGAANYTKTQLQPKNQHKVKAGPGSKLNQLGDQ